MGEEQSGAGKGFMSSALLVAAVGAIMLAGMLLRSDGRTEPEPSSPAPAPQSLPLGSEIAPEPASRIAPARPETLKAVEPPPRVEPPQPSAVPAPDPVVMKLARRAEADSGRLSKARGRWTAQLLVACKPDTVERLLASASGSNKIYVLPARVKDDACFRVCFGDYATPKEAAAAADLPRALRGKDKIGAAEIARVLP
jgi:septal ring-binding cell division protein DamX